MRKTKVPFNELQGKKHRIKVLFPLKSRSSCFGFWKEYLAGELASLLLAEGDRTAAALTPLAWFRADFCAAGSAGGTPSSFNALLFARVSASISVLQEEFLISSPVPSLL